MTNEGLDRTINEQTPYGAARLPKAVIDASLADGGQADGKYDARVLEAFGEMELSPVQEVLIGNASFIDGASGYYKIQDRLKVVRDEGKRQALLSEELRSYEASPDPLKDEDKREIFHNIYTPASHREQVPPSHKEEIFSIRIPSFSVDPIGSVRSVIDEKIAASNTAQTYLGIMLDGKKAENGWVLDVWANNGLDSAEKVEKLDDYADWILDSRAIPQGAEDVLEGVVFKHRLTGKYDRVNPAYQSGLVVETIIEAVIAGEDKDNNQGDATQKFRDFIYKLAAGASMEDQDPDYVHPYGNIIKKSALAGAYLSSIANYLYNDGSSTQVADLSHDPEKRALAMVQIAEILEDAEKMRAENTGKKTKNPFIVDNWLYSKVVSDHVDNPYLAEAYLARVSGSEGDPSSMTRRILREQPGKLHDDFVNLAISVIQNVSTQNGRNELAPKVGLLLNKMNQDSPVGANRKHVIAIANQIKKVNNDSQLITGEEIADTYDALAYILESTRTGHASADTERYDATYLALAETVLGFSTRRHSDAYLKAVENALAGGRGYSGWYKSLNGRPAPLVRTGPKTPGMQVRSGSARPPKGILS